jgi:WD40 repeat protein
MYLVSDRGSVFALTTKTQKVKPVSPKEESGPSKEEKPKEAAPAEAIDRVIRVLDVSSRVKAQTHPLIVPESRIMVEFRVEVPSERDGRLVFVATELKKGEKGRLPARKLIPAEFGVLAIQVNPQEQIAEEEEVFIPGNGNRFRRVRETDVLIPGRVQVARMKKTLRKLDLGDKVEQGDLLAMVNPVLALDDLDVKCKKLDQAEADREASKRTKEEAEIRYKSMMAQRARNLKSVSDEDYRGAKLTWDKYIYEEIAKTALVRQSQRELSASLTQLKMHEIRASTSGVIKFQYKYTGDAVKTLEPVLQIQNPKHLRIEGTVDVQNAVVLRERLRKAREAQQPLLVKVEASRPEEAQAVLKGHLHEVTGVAVSKGNNPVICSASEDHTARVWGRAKGEIAWQEKTILDHGVVVRAVACTGPKAAANMLLTATEGRGHLFDLDDLAKGEQKTLKGGHSGAIYAVAFSPDGKQCVTGGEDRAICVWEVATGKLLHQVRSAHKAAVTSLQYATSTRLVSAGRDKRLLVWDLDDDKGPQLTGPSFDRRSLDVPTLGVSPDGKQVLFDEGRELRVLSLETNKLDGTLQNPPGAVNFSTMALFSPDGKMILTNGAAAGRLQLWRTPTGGGPAAELRRLLWNSAPATCGAFAPQGGFAVTGTQDHQILVWQLPTDKEASEEVPAFLTYVEEFLDSSLQKVTIRAELENPGWLIPGSTATMVIPPPK